MTAATVEWGDAATWFQAVCTVGALGLALSQGYAAARRERSRDRATMVRVWSLSTEGLKRAEDALRRVNAAEPGDDRAELLAKWDLRFELEAIVSALHGFDETALPTAEAIDHVVDLRFHLSEFRRHVDELRRAYEEWAVRRREMKYRNGDDDFEPAPGRRRRRRKQDPPHPAMPDLQTPIELTRQAIDALKSAIASYDKHSSVLGPAKAA